MRNDLSTIHPEALEIELRDAQKRVWDADRDLNEAKNRRRKALAALLQLQAEKRRREGATP